MKGSRRKMFQFAIILAIVLLASNGMAKELLLTLSQAEYSSPSRTGTLKFYNPETPSPLAGSPFDTGLWIESAWNSICTSSIFMSGGSAKGWLLGPITEAGLLSVHSELFGTTASAAFGMVIDEFGFFGSGKRNPCSGKSTDVAFGFILIFILERPQGKYVGDLFYMTEISPRGEWYKLMLK